MLTFTIPPRRDVLSWQEPRAILRIAERNYSAECKIKRLTIYIYIVQDILLGALVRGRIGSRGFLWKFSPINGKRRAERGTKSTGGGRGGDTRHRAGFVQSKLSHLQIFAEREHALSLFVVRFQLGEPPLKLNSSSFSLPLVDFQTSRTPPRYELSGFGVVATGCRSCWRCRCLCHAK